MSTSDIFYSSIASVKNNPPKLRLDYLDGLRGLSALYVVLLHVSQIVEDRLHGNGLLSIAYPIMLKYGRDAVGIFIVLSGYCLMLPVVRSESRQLRGGVVQYIKRRGRRILPPYYAVLILSLLITAFVPMNQPFMGFQLNLAQSDFTPGILLSHFLLLHNLKPEWIHGINYNTPLWSVATEWQIYFFFPILLIIWRRFTIIPVVATAFIVGFAPHYLLDKYFDPAVPDFLALFALGMAAAEIGFSQKANQILLKERFPWKWLTIMAYLGVVTLSTREFEHLTLITDVLTGVGTTSLIIYCTYFWTKSKRTRFPLILGLLESRWVVGLGTFSYSLYLVHYPILQLVNIPLISLHMSSTGNILALLLVGLPLSILVAYIFHLAFERPFMSNHLGKAV